MDPQLLAEELRAAPAATSSPRRWSSSISTGSAPTTSRSASRAEWYDVPIIEDAAEALGATYDGQAAGTFGALGVFSFNGNKIITTSGGGMLVCGSKELADRARFLATQARDPAPHYQHSQIGYNYRLSNLLAAVGRGQLRVLEDRVATAAGELRLLPRRPGRRARHRLHARTPPRPLHPLAHLHHRRSAAVSAPRGKTSGWRLEAANIESRPTWKPMHLQPVFSHCRLCGGAVAEWIFEQGLCLPSGSNLAEDDLLRIVNIVRIVGHCPPLTRNVRPAMPQRKAA